MITYMSLLHKRGFRLLCFADAVSVLGDQAGWIGLLWFAMVSTHKSTDMGLLALCFGMPGVVLGAVSGNILDRFSRKWILVGVNAALGMIFMVIPYRFYLHRLSFELLLFLVILAGCLAPFTTVGFMVLLPSLVSEGELGAANSLAETLWQFGSLFGPILGGVLISRLGATEAILVDGLTFWCAAFCLALIRNSEISRRFHKKSAAYNKSAFWNEVFLGVKYLYNSKPVWWITISAIFLNMAYGQIEVGLPLFVHHELAASAALLGALWAVYFVGSILGTILSGFVTQGSSMVQGKLVRFSFRKGIAMCIMIAGWGICLLPLFWIHAVWFTFVSLFLAAFVFAGSPPLARTAVQQLVPSEYQGRVFGIRMSFIAFGIPVGSYISGVFAKWVEPSTVIGISGLAMIGLSAILLSIKDFRKI
jgi:MFS family permease